MYKLLITSMDGTPSHLLRIEDNTIIPIADDNTDYQAYLKWLEEGNTPEVAD